MLEGYTTLGFLAGQTSACELGLLVTGVTYRHPGLLAKIVTTLDVLSGGRAHARHRRRLVRARAPRPRRAVPAGRPSASSGSRRRCRSACRCGATTTARSRARTTSWPRRSASRRRSSQPRPPILIGGGGERKTLRLVARYADACNLFAIDARRGRPTSSTCSARTARPRAATPPTIEKTIIAHGRPARRRRRLPRRHGGYAALGDHARSSSCRSATPWPTRPASWRRSGPAWPKSATDPRVESRSARDGRHLGPT